jgi:hypothetical protein
MRESACPYSEEVGEMLGTLGIILILNPYIAKNRLRLVIKEV